MHRRTTYLNQISTEGPTLKSRTYWAGNIIRKYASIFLFKFIAAALLIGVLGYIQYLGFKSMEF